MAFFFLLEQAFLSTYDALDRPTRTYRAIDILRKSA